MGKRLKKYIIFIQSLLSDKSSIKDVEKLKKELLVQIGFWQHERLIHLMVTILFAALLMTMIVLSFFYVTVPTLLLTLMFLVLVIPYIRHYYILENGVQQLYRFYEEIAKINDSEYIADYENIDLKVKKR